MANSIQTKGADELFEKIEKRTAQRKVERSFTDDSFKPVDQSPDLVTQKIESRMSAGDSSIKYDNSPRIKIKHPDDSIEIHTRKNMEITTGTGEISKRGEESPKWGTKKYSFWQSLTTKNEFNGRLRTSFGATRFKPNQRPFSQQK